MVKWLRLGWAWEDLARQNPLGAILTRDGQLSEWNPQEFFATGRADIGRFMATLSRLAPDTARTHALDFGCGVGRITRALADHFDQVVGVDVAPSMIDRARTLHAEVARCRFVLNREPHLRGFASGSFTVAYSRLVLQHVPPELARRYIAELVRVLAPGGVLMFQLCEPINPRKVFEDAPVLGSAFKRSLPRPLVVSYRRLKYPWLSIRRGAQVEMFGIPRDEVVEVIRAGGGRVLELVPDQSHGPDVPGFEYWVTR
jgi:SAM-dependent methyltransferase